LVTGTFISRDPLGFVDGPNVYTYVRQNPWSKFDPLGLAAKALLKLVSGKADDLLKYTDEGIAMVSGVPVTKYLPKGAIPGQTYRHKANSGTVYDVQIKNNGFVES
jgi:uncharacterized protein RhaS with RHS repeats